MDLNEDRRKILEIMDKLKGMEQVIVSDENFLELKKQAEELAEFDDEESKKELEELGNKWEEYFMTTYVNPIFSQYTVDEMKNMILSLSEEMFDDEERYYNFLNNDYFISTYEQLLEGIIKHDQNFFNELLKNQEFFNFIKPQPKFVSEFITKCSDEEAVYKFIIEYAKEFNSAEELKDPNLAKDNVGLSVVLGKVITSKNFSQDLIKKLLADKDLMAYVDQHTFLTIIEKIDLTYEEKKTLFLKENVFDGLSEHYVMTLTGEIATTYEEAYDLLTTPKIFNQIRPGNGWEVTTIRPFFNKTTLKKDDLLKIIRDPKFAPNIDASCFYELLGNPNLDFQSKIDILFEPDIFKQIDVDTFISGLDNGCFTEQQRLDILTNPKVLEMAKNNSYISGVSNLLISYHLTTKEKLYLLTTDPYKKHVIASCVTSVLLNPEVTVQQAKEIIFDDEIFYRLIEEYHEVYNPDGSKLYYPPRYDKKAVLEKLYEKNPAVVKTLNFDLFKDDMLDFGMEFIETASKHPELASKASCLFFYGNNQSAVNFKNMLKVVENSIYADKLTMSTFVARLMDACTAGSPYSPPTDNKLFTKINREISAREEEMTEERWQILTQIAIRDTSIYYNDIFVTFLGVMKDPIDPKFNIHPEVATIEDLDTYEAKRQKLCDEIFEQALNAKDLSSAKNAYLNKYFNINIQEAREIVRLYSHSISQFENVPEYKLQVSYIKQIKRVMGICDLEVIRESYHTPDLKPISIDETIYIDQGIVQMFGKNISDSVYKVTDVSLDEEKRPIKNPIMHEFVLEENGVKVKKMIPVYDPGLEFKMLIHSTAAYGKMTLINDNYFDSWNKSDRKSNHGICCSLIANDNMGMAAVNDVLFGFDSWDDKAMPKVAPYDIYSSNDRYEIIEGRPLLFMTAQDIIDNTRHTHNEQVLERTELRPDKMDSEFPNIQPSYVIVYSDMPDEIKANAVKCSQEMQIPIVYLDKERIIVNEQRKIDDLIETYHQTTSVSDKLDMVQKIILIHENNRSGIRMTNPSWREKYFPTGKVDKLLEETVLIIQEEYRQTGDLSEYFRQSSKLMEILDAENKKFQVTMESTDRKNYIDLPVQKYKQSLIDLIDKNILLKTIPRLDNILQIDSINNPNDMVYQTITNIDFEDIVSKINLAQEQGIYLQDDSKTNIQEIERVAVLSKVIASGEKLDQDLTEMLVDCAIYHKCAVKKGKNSRQAAVKSAEAIDQMLSGKYSEEQLAMMKAIVEYQGVNADAGKFKRICAKYNISEDKIEIAQKLSDCLRDAIELNKTREANPNSKSNQSLYTTETAKDTIAFAEFLNRRYESLPMDLYRISVRQELQKTSQVETEIKVSK